MANSIIEILIDYSGSMGYMKGTEFENKFLINGKTRFSITKQMLQKHIFPIIDYMENVVVRLFMAHSTEGEKVTEFHLHEERININKLNSYIANLPDPQTGGTPIAAALNAARENLEKYPNYDRKILLITDGVENTGSNYVEAAKAIDGLSGTPCKIYVIGLDQSLEIEEKSRTIATGGYFNIKSQYFEDRILDDFLVTLKLSILQNSIETIELSEDKPSKKNIQKIEKKMNQIVADHNISTNKLVDNIQIQIDKTKTILTELEVIKEQLRVKQLLNSGIESTTLTIDDDYSEDIKIKSETLLYEYLCKQHGEKHVVWLNQIQESYQNHDFEIQDNAGSTIQVIECKGTPKSKPTFYMTANEWSYFLSHQGIYQVYRVLNLDTTPQILCFGSLFHAILEGKIVPYLTKPEILKENRVYLTIL